MQWWIMSMFGMVCSLVAVWPWPQAIPLTCYNKSSVRVCVAFCTASVHLCRGTIIFEQREEIKKLHAACTNV